MAIQSPNYTQIPNEILDDWMSKLSGSEFKVLIKICRNTFGWRKSKDKISTSQIMEYTGLGNKAVIEAVRSLCNHDLIIEYQDGTKTKSYEINTESSQLMSKSHKACVKSTQDEPKTYVKSTYTKEIVKENINKKDCAFGVIREWFEKNNHEYYHGPKHAVAINKIIGRFKDIDKIIKVCEKYKIKIYSGEKYWRELPLTPAVMFSHLDSILKDVPREKELKPFRDRNGYLESIERLIEDGDAIITDDGQIEMVDRKLLGM